MHDSAKKSFSLFKENYLDTLGEIKIVEIGSKSVNSDIRNALNKNFKYIGLDIDKGKNVDLVLENPYKFPFEDSSVDVIVSISVFEHTEFFWLTFLEILRVLKPEGLFFLNAPSNSKYHQHETDNWRFYPDSSLALEKWGKFNSYNPKVLEHYTNYENGRDIWNDYVSIIIKDEKFKEKYPNRILDKKKNFTNGRTDKSKELINFRAMPQDQDNFGWKAYFKFRKLIYKFKNKD